MFELSVHAHRALWWLLMLLSLANVAVLTTLASVYAASETPYSLLWTVRVYYLYSDASQFLIQYGKMVLATGYALLATLFAGIALQLIGYSLAHRNLRSGTAASRLSHSLSSMLKSRDRLRPASLSARWWQRCWQCLQCPLRRFYHACGVQGPYFDLRLLFDELFELATQSIVAYSSSQSISNVPLNQIYGVIIFGNSISALVLDRVLSRHDLVTQRLACLVCDIVLDFVWGTILPVWSWRSLLQVYGSENGDDSIEFAVNTTRELERVLVISWTNFALSIIPYGTSFLSILELLDVLRGSPRRHPLGTRTSPVRVVPSPHIAPHLHSTFYPRQAPTTLKPPPQAWRERCSLVFAVRVLMACYGTAILFISLSANGFLGAFRSHSQYGCLHRVNPWLSTQEACTGRIVCCSTVGITGSKTDISQALELFDARSLSDLILLDCSALEIPSSVQRFPRLQMLMIKDSTLVGWEDDAALSTARFTGLRALNMNNVSFASHHEAHGLDQELPGLLRHDLPSSVEWVHLERIVHADQWLLQPLYERHLWRHILFFDCNKCGLTAAPAILSSMSQVVCVALVDNDMANLVDDWQLPNLQSIWLDGNPRLTELPDTLWHAATTLVSMADTNLSFVPPWLVAQSQPGFIITASGTPLCKSNSGKAPTELQTIVSCDAGW